MTPSHVLAALDQFVAAQAAHRHTLLCCRRHLFTRSAQRRGDTIAPAPAVCTNPASTLASGARTRAVTPANAASGAIRFHRTPWLARGQRLRRTRRPTRAAATGLP